MDTSAKRFSSAAIISVVLGALLSMIEPVNAETIGLNCNGTRFTVDLAARTVSWDATGQRFVVPAQITATSIDWVFDNPGIIKSESHIDRSTGFMTSIDHYYPKTWSAPHRVDR